MAPKPSVTICLEKMKLIQEYANAVSEYNRMQSAQVRALQKGDGFLFTEQIAEATLRKEEAKYTVLKHQEEHGC